MSPHSRLRVLRALAAVVLVAGLHAASATAAPDPPRSSLPAVEAHPAVIAAPVSWSALQEAIDARAAWYAWAAALPVPEPEPPLPMPARPRPARLSGSSDGNEWDRIAQCESGGDWSANTGNGYRGGLQMDAAFWSTYGGREFASTPDQASREEQIIVAERARDSGRGYGPWPVCGRRA